MEQLFFVGSNLFIIKSYMYTYMDDNLIHKLKNKIYLSNYNIIKNFHRIIQEKWKYHEIKEKSYRI